MHLYGTVMEIWRLKDNEVTSLTFWGHVTIRFPVVIFLSVVHSACVYLAPLWRHGRLNFFQVGSSRNRGRSLVGRLVLNIKLILYTPLHYVRNVMCEE